MRLYNPEDQIANAKKTLLGLERYNIYIEQCIMYNSERLLELNSAE